MMELVFVACLIGQPEHCEEKSLQFVEGLSHTACMVGAQPQLAQWTETHPDWRIESWSCRSAEEAEYRA